MAKVLNVLLVQISLAYIFIFGLLSGTADAIPFRSILSFHACLSFKRALQYRWITEEKYQQFKEYLELSEGAIDPHQETEEVLENLQLLGY